MLDTVTDISADIVSSVPEIDQSLARVNQGVTESARELTRLLGDLYQRLRSKKSWSVLEQRLMQQPLATNSWWNWLELLQLNNCRAGLLSVFPKHPIPLHDHPNISSTLLIISGEVVIGQYDKSDQARRKNLVALRKLAIKRHSPGEVSIVARQGNIHALHSVTRPAYLLSMQFDGAGSDAAKSWYFPLPTQTSPSLLWTRRIQFSSKIEEKLYVTV